MSSRISRTVNVRMASVLAVAFASTPLLGQVEEVAILRPDPPLGSFGGPAAISGDFVVVGAGGDNEGGLLAGAAFVFKRDNATWSQHAKLIASDSENNRFFGLSVAIEGDRIAIGAPHIVTQSGRPGKAYIFRREGSSWVEEAILIPSRSHNGDDFGWSVSLNGDQVAVGAPRPFVGGIPGGAAYVFRREGTNWIEESVVSAADAGSGDDFGNSISLHNNLLVVGAQHSEDEECEEFITCSSGAAYIFRREDSSWIQEAKLTAGNAAFGARFGRAVSLSGDNALIGSRRTSDVEIRAGSAYVFHRRGPGDWIEQAELVASDAEAFDEFGRPVSIDGNLALIGGPGNDDACPEDDQCNSGSAYLFLRVGSTWGEILKFAPEIPFANSSFGFSVSLVGGDAVIGSGGRVYVFKIDRAEEGIPTISTWGLTILALLLVTVARVQFKRRRLPPRHSFRGLRSGLIVLPLVFSADSIRAQMPDLNAPHHPEHILVRFNPETSDTIVATLNGQLAAVELKRYRLISGLYLLKVPASDLETKLNAYLADTNVKYAEPDYLLTPHGVPNDEHFGEQWGMHNTGQTLQPPGEPDDPGTQDADIDAPEAWDVWTGDPDFRIAVFENGGVFYNHPDLKGTAPDFSLGNIWTNPREMNGSPGVDDDGNGWVDDIHGYDFGDDDGDPIGTNPLGLPPTVHGTFVAGILGAIGNNSIGVAGVNRQCKLVPLKYAIGPNDEALASSVIEGLIYCMVNGITLSNHSWGMPTNSQALEDAIRRAQTFGHIVVNSAGNEERDIDIPGNADYPCSYDLPNIICVAATDNDDNLGDWGVDDGSNWGVTTVDLGAPGTNTYGTIVEEPMEGTIVHTYGFFGNGTSWAAPHVTGVVALVMSRYPNMKWDMVKKRVLDTVRTPLVIPNPLAGKTVTEGIVNAYSAVADCNLNGIRDECDIQNCDQQLCGVGYCGTSQDCNSNGIPDECELDCNMNGQADVCESWFPVPPNSPSNDHCDDNKNRYLTFEPTNAGAQTAIRVTLTSSSKFPEAEQLSWWVQEPDTVCENSGEAIATCNNGICTGPGSGACSVPSDCCGPAPGIPQKMVLWSQVGLLSGLQGLGCL